MEPEFLRYSCQVALPGFGAVAQRKLQQAKVLIVGAGGLGCPAAQYLTAAGVGTVCIADGDVISLSNLHRQILYTPGEIGLKKAAVAMQKLQLQNPAVKIVQYDERITSENVIALVKQYDIVVDATDNFETKYLLNDACVLTGKPLVYGAIYQYEGQVAVWNVINDDHSRSPNYRDLFPVVNEAQIPDCAGGGVLPTLAGMIGCMQANEVIKYIGGTGELLSGKLLILDALTLQSRIIKIGAQTKTTITTITETADAPDIAASDLKTGMEQGMYDLIDVRTAEERNLFNIGGTHIPLDEIENSYIHPVNSKPIIVYCTSGKRSGAAVNIIKRKFPSAVIFSLRDGLKDWDY